MSLFAGTPLRRVGIASAAMKARSRTGASLKQFHDAFVAQGGLPIPLVRRIRFRARPAASR
jgi:hypothetical protein